MEPAAAAAAGTPATAANGGVPTAQGAAEPGDGVVLAYDPHRVLLQPQSGAASDDADLAARELISVVAGLAGGRSRERDSLPTEDKPSPPGAKRHKATTTASQGVPVDDADSPALTLAKLRGHAAAQDELQAAEEGARVEKWFFNRWYTGTVLGSSGPPIRAKGRAMVSFEGAALITTHSLLCATDQLV